MTSQPSLFDITAGKHQGNPRSVEANRKVEPVKESVRKAVYAKVVEAGSNGTTLKEVAARMGVQVNTISGRFTELEDVRNKRYGPERFIVIKPGPPRNGCSVYVADIYSHGEAVLVA